MKPKIINLMFIGIILAFFSCQSEENLPILIDESTSVISDTKINDPVLNDFLKKNSLSISNIQYRRS